MLYPNTVQMNNKNLIFNFSISLFLIQSLPIVVVACITQAHFYNVSYNSLSLEKVKFELNYQNDNINLASV